MFNQVETASLEELGIREQYASAYRIHRINNALGWGSGLRQPVPTVAGRVIAIYHPHHSGWKNANRMVKFARLSLDYEIKRCKSEGK